MTECPHQLRICSHAEIYRCFADLDAGNQRFRTLLHTRLLLRHRKFYKAAVFFGFQLNLLLLYHELKYFFCQL